MNDKKMIIAIHKLASSPVEFLEDHIRYCQKKEYKGGFGKNLKLATILRCRAQRVNIFHVTTAALPDGPDASSHGWEPLNANSVSDQVEKLAGELTQSGRKLMRYTSYIGLDLTSTYASSLYAISSKLSTLIDRPILARVCLLEGVISFEIMFESDYGTTINCQVQLEMTFDGSY